MKTMSLRKRMFRSGMMILCSAILAMAVICVMIALLFEDTLEKDFASVTNMDTHSFLYKIVRSYQSLFFIGVLIVLFAVVVLFVVSYVFSRRLNQQIMEPLNALSEGAKRIKEGNLKEEIIYHGDSEFENVCQMFNEMQKTILEDQKQREQNEAARKDMVTGISHDLRTPLTSIQGYIKGILDGIADTEEKQQMYLKTAYQSTKEMNVLLEKLFEFSKIESGQTQFHMVPVDLSEYTQAYIAQKEMEYETIEFLYTRQQEILPEVLIDVDQMRRVFDNLLENSIKYSNKEPVQISVTAGVDKDGVSISWKDNGAGVDEDKLAKIFDRFYRCDEARNKKGSGVGLYVVKYIIEQQMGHIDATNDHGLKMTMHFPIIKESK